MKLGILATHPIQYQAPLFRELASRSGIDLTVYFAHRPSPQEQGAGFGVAFAWDIDLTSGYNHLFLHNHSRKPTQGFWGYDTPEITEIIRRERFDLFIVHGWACKSSWQAFRACWKTGTKLGVRSDSQLPQGRLGLRQKLKDMAKRLFYPRFIGKFDVCLPYGKRSAEYFSHFGGRNIVVAPHFVDNEWFAAKAAEYRKERHVLRREWQIPEDAVCFLFCGKLCHQKRPLDILLALRLLMEINHNSSKLLLFHLLIVGDGALREQCENYAREFHLPVTFAGFLNQGEIAKAYAVADCLVLPSASETWGLVVNEAMACGLPAIVSEACGCVPDLIRDAETGFTFPCGNLDVLAEKMRLITGDNELLQAQNVAAARHILTFSTLHAADCLVKASNSI